MMEDVVAAWTSEVVKEEVKSSWERKPLISGATESREGERLSWLTGTAATTTLYLHPFDEK